MCLKCDLYFLLFYFKFIDLIRHLTRYVISYLLIWYFNTKCRGFIIKPHENAKLSVRKTTISIRQTAAVPIISRLTQGIHYQVHLCRCKTAAALCVTNGGKLLHKPRV